MASHDSVSEWIADAKTGARCAADRLYQRYYERLLFFARPRINQRNRALASEEDIAQSVLHVFSQGVQNGRFHYIQNRTELWGLLIRITSNKIIDYHRRFGRIGENQHVVRVSELRPDKEGFCSRQHEGATIIDVNEPYMFARLHEQFGQLLESLQNDETRHVAVLRMKGNSVEEIAEDISKSVRSVERKTPNDSRSLDRTNETNFFLNASNRSVS